MGVFSRISKWDPERSFVYRVHSPGDVRVGKCTFVKCPVRDSY